MCISACVVVCNEYLLCSLQKWVGLTLSPEDEDLSIKYAFYIYIYFLCVCVCVFLLLVCNKPNIFIHSSLLFSKINEECHWNVFIMFINSSL